MTELTELLDIIAQRPALSWVNAMLTFVMLVVWLTLGYVGHRHKWPRAAIFLVVMALGAEMIATGVSAWVGLFNITVEYKEWLGEVRMILAATRVASIVFTLQAIFLLYRAARA